jgi:diacylglycerol O-acyltransferase / wax synthase
VSTVPSPDRASAADLMQFATGDRRAAGHIGAVLVLGAAPGFCVEQARRVLGERIRAVPRLRQRLYRAPPGCGRPYWADDPAFDIDEHVRQVRCPPPGDERALLDLAAAQLGEPLPLSRPLWSATFVTGLAGGGTGLLFVMDHVLADGTAALAMLGTLADQGAGAAQARAGPFPAPAPRARELAVDAWRDRLRRAGRAGSGPQRQARGLRRIREGMAELGGTRPRRRPVTSLNQPVGPRRRLDVVAVDLDGVRDLGHAHGGTVNDVVLAAVAGALRTLLAARGEQFGEVTITVPVAARRAASGGELGNQIGIMPVTVPAAGDLGARVTRAAEITRERKSHARGASATLFVPVFLLLARTGLLRWFASHQRAVQTFVTNVRGPEAQLLFGGAAVRAIIPIPSTTGNVTVTFAASSYARTLRITILSDPARMPDAPALAAALRHELAAPLPASQRPAGGEGGPGRPGPPPTPAVARAVVPQPPVAPQRPNSAEDLAFTDDPGS